MVLNSNGNEVKESGWEKLGRRILVTGGCGYIGSITVLRLLEQGFRVSIIDNFSNSTPAALNQVRMVANNAASNRIHFQFGDLRNVDDIEKLFSKLTFDAVIHFAGRKAVGESMENPIIYFDNNVVGTINLYKVMAKYNCKKLVFSSSCTVYGDPEKVPCTEDTPLKPVNPYGRTKLFLEEVAHDLQRADPDWKIIQLRYFNPVGAHGHGRIGEHPKGPPNNLFPYISLVANEKLTELNVYGNDYPTPDGTAIRDYIHVIDLADGHICAVSKLFEDGFTGCHEYNLGTGKGTSVLEMVAAFERACGKKIPIKMCPRRPGDAAVIYSNPEKAEKELGWKATHDIEQACVDQWSWAHSNPDGYKDRE